MSVVYDERAAAARQLQLLVEGALAEGMRASLLEVLAARGIDVPEFELAH